MEQLPRDFVTKLKSLDYNVMVEIVDRYLTKKEIKAVLLRRDLILEWLNKRVAAYGETAVFYDR
jgi:hypothetical protein